ncbi:MAG: hypothetical protein EB127_28785, partial [Alphaproteobacteria bacterium]|nr:hypothetical protein [Alphaproteobacteria bacterium]
DEEAEFIKNSTYDGDKLKWCYYYSEDTLRKKILELEEMGVTDLMITPWPNDPEVERVHKFVKKMVERQ